jgi:hypothetical protein
MRGCSVSDCGARHRGLICNFIQPETSLHVHFMKRSSRTLQVGRARAKNVIRRARKCADRQLRNEFLPGESRRCGSFKQ